jgi:hypothetical protein
MVNMGYAIEDMKRLFNKTFYHFTMGFIGILIASFALAAFVANMEDSGSVSASAPRAQ